MIGECAKCHENDLECHCQDGPYRITNQVTIAHCQTYPQFSAAANNLAKALARMLTFGTVCNNFKDSKECSCASCESQSALAAWEKVK